MAFVVTHLYYKVGKKSVSFFCCLRWMIRFSTLDDEANTLSLTMEASSTNMPNFDSVPSADITSAFFGHCKEQSDMKPDSTGSSESSSPSSKTSLKISSSVNKLLLLVTSTEKSTKSSNLKPEAREESLQFNSSRSSFRSLNGSSSSLMVWV